MIVKLAKEYASGIEIANDSERVKVIRPAALQVMKFFEEYI